MKAALYLETRKLEEHSYKHFASNEVKQSAILNRKIGNAQISLFFV